MPYSIDYSGVLETDDVLIRAGLNPKEFDF